MQNSKDQPLNVLAMIEDMQNNMPPEELAAKYGFTSATIESPEDALDLGNKITDALAEQFFGDTPEGKKAAAYVKERMAEHLLGQEERFVRAIRHVAQRLQEDGEVCNCAFLVGLGLVDRFAEKGGFESGGELINMYMERAAAKEDDEAIHDAVFEWMHADGSKEGLLKIPVMDTEGNAEQNVEQNDGGADPA